MAMFRFPVDDPDRLALWIRNSGNILLDSLTDNELRGRYVCAAHFLHTNVHKNQVRSRLVGSAVPVPFQHVEDLENTNQIHEFANTEVDVQSSPEDLRVKTPTKCYIKRSSATANEYDHKNVFKIESDL